MPWPTWQQSGLLALLCLGIALVLRRSRPTRTSLVLLPALDELALISGLYCVWRIARQLPLTHEEGALERAHDVVAVQNWLHLPTELSLQRFVAGHDWLVSPVNAYYAIVHVPALIVFLIWLFVRHRDLYPHWRNGLAWVTAGCLAIRFVRVAPPRFLVDLGYIDLAYGRGFDVYGKVGTGVSDQFAAMPSIHVGWAAVVALGVMACSESRWRWVALSHLPITVLVVAATGHHWWLDGIVAVALLAGGLAIDTKITRWRDARRAASERLTDSAPVEAFEYASELGETEASG